MRDRLAVPAVLVSLLFLAAPAIAGVVTISEVAYDAVGSDDGRVFIELFGSPGLGLSDWVLEGVNGSNGAVTHRVDLAPFTIPVDGFFVLADALSGGGTLVPEADGVLPSIDLQNGPDSLRLLHLGVVVDAVGYGAFGASHFFSGEGASAADGPAGSSLARRFADIDTDVNALDFVVLDVPTPGAGPLSVPPATEVPEPGTWALMGMGCLLLVLARRHSRRQRTSPPSEAR